MKFGKCMIPCISDFLAFDVLSKLSVNSLQKAVNVIIYIERSVAHCYMFSNW
jgi:hypothetical protein